MADWAVNLCAKLVATSGVTALCSTRIYPGIAPQKAALPFLTFQQVSAEPMNAMTPGPTSSGDKHIVVQVDAWSDRHITAIGLAAAVEAALSGWRELAVTPKVQSCLLRDERELPEAKDDGSDGAIFRVSQDYSIWLSNS